MLLVKRSIILNKNNNNISQCSSLISYFTNSYNNSRFYSTGDNNEQQQKKVVRIVSSKKSVSSVSSVPSFISLRNNSNSSNSSSTLKETTTTTTSVVTNKISKETIDHFVPLNNIDLSSSPSIFSTDVKKKTRKSKGKQRGAEQDESSVKINDQEEHREKEQQQKESSINTYYYNQDSERIDLIDKGKDTPIIKQYKEFKSKHPNSILLFRLGDFYEMLFQDAIVASKILGIALTCKGGRADTPMCGVPSHSVDVHLQKLIKSGQTIAICDQVEDAMTAKLRGGIITRQVTRVITPGTLFEDNLLNNSQNNFLCNFLPIDMDFSALDNAYTFKNERFSISWLDISTGHFFISETTFDSLPSELSRISPNEILLPRSLIVHPQFGKLLKQYHVTTDYNDSFYFANTQSKFTQTFGDDIDLLATFSQQQLNSSGSILNYIFKTQIGQIPHLYLPQLFNNQQSMFIDYSTMSSLEITKTYSGHRKGTLLDSIDKTLTSPGSRLLYSRIQSPSLNYNEIKSRLNMVEFFYNNTGLVYEIRKLLTKCLDLERCLQRVYIGKAGPKDLSAIGATLAFCCQISQSLSRVLRNEKSIDPVLSQCLAKLDESKYEELLDELSAALVDNPPFSTSDGGFIEKGYSKKLDQLLLFKDHSREMVQSITDKHRVHLNFPALKIKHNQTQGYYFEILSQQRDKIPSDFIHVQTLSSHLRYKSKELNEVQEKINIAAFESLQEEQSIFNDLCKLVLKFGEQIKEASQALAIIDVSSSLGLLSKERVYTRPTIVLDNVLHIVNGRHPTVELSMINGGTFIGNDCNVGMGKDKLWLITGPNMGGKSTFLRQNALIILMAQMGCFVPADYAEIGITDAIFSRVGSSDDLSNDKSTFMVEMIETAAILRKSTPKSFVIMDEVGRGTSTLDGLSIAQSVVEHLVQENKCRTLFATHYHELTNTFTGNESIKNYALAVQEQDDEILFTHKILPGVANKSYGIFCAKLAGLPDRVIQRSQSILSNFENNKKQ
ncbi:hypothetical protein CYY_005565 [Polysphondylium violaceum]|uniref:DNA mismatch repair proteins mutS family domain-containing protein n=1 Tax=Polysphondylium violaceum TaxID=133409 RepID=A0A8J4V6R2_9MYCE|nr:hypothetical protein CYY_005565 [Polysphondylium violaceum]